MPSDLRKYIFIYFTTNYLQLRQLLSRYEFHQHKHIYWAWLSFSKLLPAVMLFLHLFVLERWGPSHALEHVAAESSPHSSQAFTENMATLIPTAAFHYQKTAALHEDVKSWKPPKSFVLNMSYCPFDSLLSFFLPFVFLHCRFTSSLSVRS